MKSNILSILKDRGILSNITSEEKFIEILNNSPTAYVGFDPTSDSLHLGNYVQINISRLMQSHGIKVIPVLGGATGSIGDPSGKSIERNLLDTESLIKNAHSISSQLVQLYGEKTKVINNIDFYSSISFLDFLRDIGKNFNINYMLEKESIKSRLDTGISYTEFSYLILQAYDFFCLNKDYGVNIQIGGSDQFGNITAGLELIRKKNPGSDVVGITINLLTNSNGKKFGKSEKGALFLDKEKTSVYQMYQYFLNISDSDLHKMFCFLTRLDLSEINTIIQEHELSPHKRMGQKKLSEIVISDIHSKKDWVEAVSISEKLFSGTLEKLDKSSMSLIIKELPSINIDNEKISILDILSMTISGSKSQATRDINSNSIYLNGELVCDLNYMISISDFKFEKAFLLRKGKKNYFVVRLKNV